MWRFTVQTVFVTGAEGFAGAHLIEILRQRGIEVVAGARNRGRKLAIEKRHGKAIVCDVSDAINVARAIASIKPDGIIHLAGSSRAFTASTEPLEAYQSIVSGWANVLDAVRRTVPRARVLMISAADVYGNAGADGHAIPETTAAQPITTFGDLKATAESIAHSFFRNYHLNVTIARPFTYTGPGQSDQFFFGSVAKRLAGWNNGGGGHELRLPDLSFSRDMLHVKDVAEAYVKLLTDGKPNEIYNVCSGAARTCREMIETMVRTSGQTITLTEIPSEQFGINCLRGDNSKLCNELGWKPTRTADEALTELVRGFQAQTAQTPKAEPVFA